MLRLMVAIAGCVLAIVILIWAWPVLLVILIANLALAAFGYWSEGNEPPRGNNR